MDRPQLPVVVSLATGDRARSYAFYRDGLGLDAIGKPADDGVPEPLQFVLSPGARLMLIPTGGFSWVIGDRQVAPPSQSECVLTLTVSTSEDVDALVARAQAAGAKVLSIPATQPWGYASTLTDPDGHLWMVTATPPPD